MAKAKKSKPQDYRWGVYRLKKTPAALVGHVSAPDKETAVKRAIEEFKITNRPNKRGCMPAGTPNEAAN